MKYKLYGGYAILHIAIVVAVGATSSLLIKNNVHLYTTLYKPPIAPPSYVFPIVWSILYLLMALSAYMVCIKEDTMRRGAMCIYGLQLSINFIWPLVFFNTSQYFLAFLILCILWLFVFVMIAAFMQVSVWAARLQYPYLAWISYALYLNLGVFISNF